MTNKKQHAQELLKIHYGFKTFRPGQEKVIDNILDGKSTLVIMPTGGGKSLCYQLPALVLEGITIVISPLIALMKDQVDSLNKIGIPATFINSSISADEARERLEYARAGKYKLVYIAPERFYNKEFTESLKDIKVSLFAIDEAHCISQWGHDFRPSYLRLKFAIEMANNPIVIALTATATPEVRDDIIKQLNLNNPEVVITGFARPNLQFGVIEAKEVYKPKHVLDIINSLPGETGIIYVGTRTKADDLLQILLDNNIEAVGYHAGMETEDRKWVQENFMTGKAKVIVATNAFGLGIDKKNIRFVIHYDMPGTIEAYYQEAGRAGRDGEKSYCILLYNQRDRYLREFFIKGDNPPPNFILDIYELLTNQGADKIFVTYAELKKMLNEDVPEMAVGTSLKILEREGYLSRPKERRGSAYLKILKDYEKILEFLGAKAKKKIEIFNKLYERYKDEMIKGWEVNFEETAGLLQIKKDSIMRLVRNLNSEGLIEYVPPFKGTEINIIKRIPKEEIDIDFTALKEKMRAAYKKLDMMEEYVFYNNCRQGYILKYFGENDFTFCQVCDNCLIDSGAMEKRKKENEEKPFSKVKKWKGKKQIVEYKVEAPDENLDFSTKLTQIETYELFNKGLSIDDIAQTRNLKPGTIYDHLSFVIEKGLPIKLEKLVSPAREKKIIDAIKKVGPERLSPIKELLGDDFSFDEIKLIRAKMKKLK